ncbi:MAG: hypothetical protein ACK4N5_06140, partial [Myxococcales bacterium]
MRTANSPVVDSATESTPGTSTRTNWGGGFQVGAYYITDADWHLGASYKSPQWIEPARINS